MAVGPGKYDDACTAARAATGGLGVVLIVLNGRHGSGFSVQAPLGTEEVLADLLEHLARQVRHDIATRGTDPR